MMCAEGLWWRCHRRLIADALTAGGWEVLHIDPRGETTVHELTEFALPGSPASRIRRMQVETHCGRRGQRAT